MHTPRLLQRSTVEWLRGMALTGALLTTLCLPSFAAEADLSLIATAAPTPVVVDGELQFYLGLINNGPDSAEDVTVEIDLPAEVSLVAATPSQGTCLPGPPLTCQLGLVGADHPFNQVGITVATVPEVVSGISLTALIVSTTPDPSPDNNAATAWLSVVELAHSADLRVDPQILPTPVFSGATMEFVIEVANDGPALAGVVDVRVGIQELRMVSYVSAFSSQGQCSTVLDTCAGFQCLVLLDEFLAVSCDLGGMAAGSTATVRVNTSIDLPEQTSLTVSARIGTEDMADSDPSNNTIAVQVPVVAIPGGGTVGSSGPGGCFLQSVFSENVNRITPTGRARP